jgi:hypothetical protein
VAKEISIIFLENLAIFFRKMGNIVIEHSLFIFYFHILAKCGTQKKTKKTIALS